MNDMTPNELVAIDPANALTVFTTPNAIDPLLERVRSEIDAFVPDVTTDKGRKAIASMAYKVARAKTYLDDAGKVLADQQKEIPKKIDACRKRIRDTLDKWRDEVRAPLTEWEDAEKARVDAHKANLQVLTGLWNIDGMDAAGIRRRLAQAEGWPIDESCEEFIDDFAKEKDALVTSLRRSLSDRERYETEQAELARLRAAEEARQKVEREERIAREAAERATREAEARAAAEAKAAADAARREREAAERRELELKLQAEQAERRAAEAEAKARREAEEKERREAAEVARREADAEHRKAVFNAALDAFVADGVDEETARKVLTLIVERKIPRVMVQF